MRKILIFAVLIVGGILTVEVLPPLGIKIPQRALEAVLQNNLKTLRDVIAQYHGDKGRYPESLEALVGEGYLRKVPLDPFTKSSETWRLTYEVQPGTNGTRGILNAHSGARGKALDGRPLASL